MVANNMQGKTVMVTGATDGIGKVAAQALYNMGANVIVVGRNPQKAANVLSEFRDKNPNGGKLDSLIADLSSLKDIRHLAENFLQKYDHLDVLLNNAGAFFLRRKTSVDGFEMTFALNHLGYFYLTYLLLDLIKDSAPSRIVSVSSGLHPMGKINFDNLNAKGLYFGWTTYANSKLMNILFTRELAKRLEGTGVTANALHPGFVATNFGHSGKGLLDFFVKLSQKNAITPEQGAQTSIYLASSPEVSGVSGKYFYKCNPVEPSPAAQDDETARRLWDKSFELIEQKMKES